MVLGVEGGVLPPPPLLLKLATQPEMRRAIERARIVDSLNSAAEALREVELKIDMRAPQVRL
jgi:hypothetical protein